MVHYLVHRSVKVRKKLMVYCCQWEQDWVLHLLMGHLMMMVDCFHWVHYCYWGQNFHWVHHLLKVQLMMRVDCCYWEQNFYWVLHLLKVQ